MKKVALYAGSFDPPHLGHLWMIEEARALFDYVIVAVSINLEKNPLFSIKERLAILTDMTAGMLNVTLTSFTGTYTALYAQSKGAQYMIRGMRTGTDFEYEHLMHQYNEDINPEVQTLILLPPKQLAQISSSAIKQLIGPSAWEQIIGKYLHPAAHYRLLARGHTIAKHLHEAGAQFEDLSFWEKLISAYTAPHRHYHNLQHIVEMLEDFMEVREQLKNPLAVEFAIWYHDYVYESNSHISEEKSWLQALVTMQEIGIHDLSFRKIISGLIFATKHKGIPTIKDELYIVDMDLGIFGKNEERFDAYERAVRKEYEWVTDKEYCEHRGRILYKFFNRKYIYLTEHFRTKYEFQARKNLERSLKNLNVL